jgi:hypothetical protein
VASSFSVSGVLLGSDYSNFCDLVQTHTFTSRKAFWTLAGELPTCAVNMVLPRMRRFPSFDGPLEFNETFCVKEIQLTRSELAFIIATRAMIGAGIALLLADRLSVAQRKAVGSTLTLVGLVTTIPAVWAIFGKCE